MPKYTVEEFSNALRVAYSNLNFEQFCALIKEPTEYRGDTNQYAMSKFTALTDVVRSMYTLGTWFNTIIEYGTKEDKVDETKFKRLAVVTSAYTGVALTKSFSDVQEYIEQLLGRPVYTHELAFQSVWNEIREKSKAELLELWGLQSVSKY